MISTRRLFARSLGRFPAPSSTRIPKHLPRIQLSDGSLFIPIRNDPAPNVAKNTLPPPIRPENEKKYHLTEQEIQEMQHLRNEDPVKWTQKALAKKFNCSTMFVAMKTQASREYKLEKIAQLEQQKEMWGWKKRLIRHNRQRRRELW